MAHVTDTNDDGLLGGTGLNHVATGATDLGVHIFRMNVRLHKIGRTEYHPSVGLQAGIWVVFDFAQHQTPATVKSPSGFHHLEGAVKPSRLFD